MATVKLPPFVTASKWDSVFQAVWNTAAKRGKHLVNFPVGTTATMTPTLAPRLTNGDVIALIMGWLAAIGRTRQQELFPFWDQYAAAAYGWDPSRGKYATPPQSRATDDYPAMLLVDFWQAQMSIADDLESSGEANPRLDLDGTFQDPVFRAEVRAALAADSGAASATGGFHIPVPACKRPDGTVGPPRCKRTMKQWPYLCEEWEKCEAVTIKVDPLAGARKTFWAIALIVGAWLVYESNHKTRRQRR